MLPPWHRVATHLRVSMSRLCRHDNAPSRLDERKQIVDRPLLGDEARVPFERDAGAAGVDRVVQRSPDPTLERGQFHVACLGRLTSINGHAPESDFWGITRL